MGRVTGLVWRCGFCVAFYLWFLLLAVPCSVLGTVLVRLGLGFLLGRVVPAVDGCRADRGGGARGDDNKEPSSPSPSSGRRRYAVMSGPDAACCLPNIDTKENRPVVSAFFSVPGRIDGDAFCARFENFFRAADGGADGVDDDAKVMFDKLRHYPVSKKGYYFWRRDEGFEVRRHIGAARRSDGTEVTYENDAQLKEFFNGRINKPFPKRVPPWEVFWLSRGAPPSPSPSTESTSLCLPEDGRRGVAASPSLFPDAAGLPTRTGRTVFVAEQAAAAGGGASAAEEAETSVCVRLHHCLGDGISLCHALLARLFDNDDDGVRGRAGLSTTAKAGTKDGPVPAAWRSKNEAFNNFDDAGNNVKRHQQQPGKTTAELFASNRDFDNDDDGGSGGGFGGGGGLGRSAAGGDRKGAWLMTPVTQWRLKLYQIVTMWLLGVVTMPVAFLRFRTNPDKNPLIKRRLTGKKVVHWLKPIPMEPLKRVRNLFGGITINDIVSTATSRAVWRYMIATYSNSSNGRNNNNNNNGSYTSNFRRSQPTGIVVSNDVRRGDHLRRRRRGAGADPAPHRRWTLTDASTVSFWTDFPREFTNKFGLCRLRMQPPMESDSVSNLLARRAEIGTHLKRWNMGFPMYMGMVMAVNVFPARVAGAIMSPPRGTTLITSNVRGPLDGVRLLGLPVTRAYAFPPQLGKCGLSVMTFGYDDDLYLSIVADTGYMPTVDDVEMLGDFLLAEIRILEDALGHMAAVASTTEA